MILALCLLACHKGAAQQEPSFSHYWAMPQVYNPAAAGWSGKINVAAAYNMAMTGFLRHPNTMNIAGDMPVQLGSMLHGIGAQITNDDIGLFSHRGVGLQYAYKQKLLGGVLSAGLQVGLKSENFNGSKLNLEDSSDPAFSTSEITGTAFDLGAGLMYEYRQWWGALSAQHITAPTVELGETNELKIEQAFYFMAGGNIKMRSPFLKISPSLMARYSGTAFRADITARLVYTHDEKMMYAGLGCSPTNSVSAYIGGIFHGITVGYSYEAYTSGISPGEGSHELFVGYQASLDIFKKGKNKHQSVRLL